jgi:hypothetical protein
MADIQDSEKLTATVEYLDPQRKRLKIDGVVYIRSWKKPRKEILKGRNAYMKRYRTDRKTELQVYRELLQKLNEKYSG